MEIQCFLMCLDGYSSRLWYETVWLAGWSKSFTIQTVCLTTHWNTPSLCSWTSVCALKVNAVLLLINKWTNSMHNFYSITFCVNFTHFLLVAYLIWSMKARKHCNFHLSRRSHYRKAEVCTRGWAGPESSDGAPGTRKPWGEAPVA